MPFGKVFIKNRYHKLLPVVDESPLVYDAGHQICIMPIWLLAEAKQQRIQDIFAS